MGGVEQSGRFCEVQWWDCTCRMVPETSKKFFPGMAIGFQDPRVAVHITDGIKWVQARPRSCPCCLRVAHARQGPLEGIVVLHAVCNGHKGCRALAQDAAKGTYDAIIVDSSDPVGPAEVLFQKVRAWHAASSSLGWQPVRACVNVVAILWLANSALPYAALFRGNAQSAEARRGH